MKSIVYALRNLSKSPGQQVIKIISLTLGLAVGLLLFSKVSFDLSYDRFIPDHNRVYQVGITYAPGSIPGHEADMSDDRVGPAFSRTMKEDFPQIETATRFVRYGGRIRKDETVYNAQVMMADTMLFDVLDLGMVAGNPKDLRTINDVLLSEAFAATLFPGEDPLGKSLTYNDVTPLTVRGVYKDIPQNSHLKYRVILSIKYIEEQWGFDMSSLQGGMFINYFKLRPGADIQEIEKEMPAFYERHGLQEKIDDGDTFHFTRVSDIHLNGYGVKSMVILLGILAFVLLFIAALNYVLISISSLTKRARSIAVQKCNGASNGNILVLFLLETVFLILISLILAFVLIYSLRGPVESLTGQSLNNLFAPERFGFLAAVVLFVFLVSGLVPGRLFAHIPVKDAFNMQGKNRKGWKQILLFIQFSGVAFAFIFLLIIIRQYDFLLNKDLGYEYDRIVYATLNNVEKSRYQSMQNDLEAMPFVEGSALTSDYFFDGLGGYSITDPQTPDEYISARGISFDHRTLPLFNIEMASGENFSENSPANSLVVNEEMIRLLGWTDNPVGKIVLDSRNRPLTIIGVTKDFQVSTAMVGLSPIAAGPIQMRDSASYNCQVMIRLNEVNRANIDRLNEYLEERFPEQRATVNIYDAVLRSTYDDQRMFRNTVSVGAVVTFVIALMGLIGYVNDEARNRRREIAIRKINGATLGDILWITSRQLLTLAIVAIVLGGLGAYYVGSNWLSNFTNQVPLSTWIFLAGGLVVLAAILLTNNLRSWRAANESPVNALKTE